MAKRSRQLSLALRPPARWGGRRRGAGRKAGPRPRVARRRRPALAARFPALVTIRVRSDVPSLRTLRLVRDLERSLRALRRRSDFRVVHYSLQGNHLHAIVEAASSVALACGMKSLGARLARAANRIFSRRGPVLADRFHLRILRTPREVRNAIAYTLLNARSHAAKRTRPLRGQVVIDPASSGRWFQGWKRGSTALIGAPDPDRPAVSRPRTWLLCWGWRRWGLVDPAEVPGRPSTRVAPPTPHAAGIPRVLPRSLPPHDRAGPSR
jgi:REP element-mobilizing transposase RayT